MQLQKHHYTPWKYSASVQKSNRGSKWYYGNFTLGLQVDSHPQFTNVILSLWFFDIVFSRERSLVQDYKMANGFALRYQQHADNPLNVKH